MTCGGGALGELRLKPLLSGASLALLLFLSACGPGNNGPMRGCPPLKPGEPLQILVHDKSGLDWSPLGGIKTVLAGLNLAAADDFCRFYNTERCQMLATSVIGPHVDMYLTDHDFNVNGGLAEGYSTPDGLQLFANVTKLPKAPGLIMGHEEYESFCVSFGLGDALVDPTVHCAGAGYTVLVEGVEVVVPDFILPEKDRPPKDFLGECK